MLNPAPRVAASRFSLLAAGGLGGLLGMTPAEHDVVSVAIIAAALVLSSLVVTVIPEWFGWRALIQPGRDLDRLLDRMESRLHSVDEVVRLARILQASHNALVDGRYQHDCIPASDTPSHQSPVPEHANATSAGIATGDSQAVAQKGLIGQEP